MADKVICIDTLELIDQFYCQVSLMSIQDYDIDEILWNITVALSFRDEIETKASAWEKVLLKHGTNGDGQRLASAWLTLFFGIRVIFEKMGMWDNRGMCDYYYDRLLGRGDMLLRQIPGGVKEPFPVVGTSTL